MKAFAKFQGVGENADYIDNLCLVHPFLIERILRKLGLNYQNMMAEKIKGILSGDMEEVNVYKSLARGLKILQKIGFGQAIGHMFVKLRLYPSLLYTVYKPIKSRQLGKSQEK